MTRKQRQLLAKIEADLQEMNERAAAVAALEPPAAVVAYLEEIRRGNS